MSTGSESEENRRVAGLLRDLCRYIRDEVVRGRLGGSDWSAVEKVAASDTIYRIDKLGEDALLEWFGNHWPVDLPVEVVAEGLGDESGERFPADAAEPLFTVLIDPIDGTRGLMHDKRSAWVLAGAARNRAGVDPTLDDLVAGAMAEIPVTRQSVSDVALGWRETDGMFGGEALRDDGAGALPQSLDLRSSRAVDLRHGFASFVSYFPAARAETARIEAAFLRRHLGPVGETGPLVFTDQYISTGGQVFELLAGRDRMVADLRPLVFGVLGVCGNGESALSASLTCHPYDLACLPVVRASGCVVEDPWGRPLRARLDTTSPVAWVGYANADLAETLRPLLAEALEECGYRPGG